MQYFLIRVDLPILKYISSETLDRLSSLVENFWFYHWFLLLYFLISTQSIFHSAMNVSSQHLRLFNDARNLMYEHDSLHVSLDGGTSKCFAAWGAQSFTSGKQYWEMLVDSSWDWAVGVCKDSWIRKDDSILDESNRDKFLLVCVKQDDHYQLWTTAPTMPLYTGRPLGRVGVFLDCDSGSISFVDVAKRTLLWRYDDGVCTFPVRPFICTGHRWGGWLTAQMGCSGLLFLESPSPVL